MENKKQQMPIAAYYFQVIKASLSKEEDRRELLLISQQRQCQNAKFARKITKTLFENFVECKI
jgi:hypothetical protein